MVCGRVVVSVKGHGGVSRWRVVRDTGVRVKGESEGDA